MYGKLFSVCFKVFDLDRDGFLSESEMEHMVSVLLHLRGENNSSAAIQGTVAIARPLLR